MHNSHNIRINVSTHTYCTVETISYTQHLSRRILRKWEFPTSISPCCFTVSRCRNFPDLTQIVGVMLCWMLSLSGVSLIASYLSWKHIIRSVLKLTQMYQHSKWKSVSWWLHYFVHLLVLLRDVMLYHVYGRQMNSHYTISPRETHVYRTANRALMKSSPGEMLG